VVKVDADAVHDAAVAATASAPLMAQGLDMLLSCNEASPAPPQHCEEGAVVI